MPVQTVTVIRSDSNNFLGGPITFATGTNIAYTQSGQTITPNVVNAAGSAFTTGSVIFAGSTGLTETNANLFWDNTNNRYGIGVNSSLTAKLQITQGASSNTEKGIFVKPSSSSVTGNMFDLQDSSGNGLFSITPKGFVTFYNDAHTFTADTVITIANSTMTFNSNGNGFTWLTCSPIWTTATNVTTIFNYNFIIHNPILTNISDTLSIYTLVEEFKAAANHSADTKACSITDWRSFYSNNQFSISTGGTTAFSRHHQFRADTVYGSGVTTTERIGYLYRNATGSGTLTNQIGFKSESLTKGGTTNVAFWQAGSGGVSLFENKVRIGDTTSAAPTQALEVKGNIVIDNGGTAGTLRFMEPSGSGTNYSEFKAQAQAGNVTYTLPNADGSANQVLSTDGSGNLTWASQTGSGATITTARKTADQSITSSTTLTDDTHITFSVTSGNIYEVWGALFATSTSGTPDIKIAFVHPGGTMTLGYHSGHDTAPAFGFLGTSGTASGDIPIAANTNSIIIIKGTYNCTSTGTFKLQWTQFNSNATATKLLLGSYIAIRAI